MEDLILQRHKGLTPYGQHLGCVAVQSGTHTVEDIVQGGMGKLLATH